MKSSSKCIEIDNNGKVRLRSKILLFEVPNETYGARLLSKNNDNSNRGRNKFTKK
jgi:hypothetical protein